ncbi:serine hydrolase domain-containing protein [Paraburkholderia caledonica]|uniref:CubicO group peptidase (Beta-lactamase class C family) n=1 Tax=Paraburkholderia caledonica TaxID=134536 RepID=A0AB73IU00_9BURK|nr:CubicO group peptidase (beta-lactamase class C family) [Paraburkholderia caledonica]
MHPLCRFAFALPVALIAASMPVFGEDHQSANPVYSKTGPDAQGYGQNLGYPVGLPLLRQPYMVGNYSHYDSLHPSHLVAKAEKPSPFERASTELQVSYRYKDQTLTVQDYLARNPTTGLLIAKGNSILFEHYQYSRNDEQRFMSESMAKTFVSMLVGVAVAEHKIRTIDDTVETYVPELQHTEIGTTSIRALLHMASGIQYTQSYSKTDDNAKLHELLLSPTGPGPIATVKTFNTRVAEPESVFSYASLDTEVLGLVLTRSTGMSLSEYLQTRVWQPMGAEADARWIVDNTGQEIASCCFNATLRDYARFGLMLAHDGSFNDRQIIPRQWVLDATRPANPGSFLALGKGEHPSGYGYQVWLLSGKRRMFALEGVYGQRIFIDPESGLVLVHTAVRTQAVGSPGEAELHALWNGLIKEYGTSLPM